MQDRHGTVQAWENTWIDRTGPKKKGMKLTDSLTKKFLLLYLHLVWLFVILISTLRLKIRILRPWKYRSDSFPWKIDGLDVFRADLDGTIFAYNCVCDFPTSCLATRIVSSKSDIHLRKFCKSDLNIYLWFVRRHQVSLSPSFFFP